MIAENNRVCPLKFIGQHSYDILENPFWQNQFCYVPASERKHMNELRSMTLKIMMNIDYFPKEVIDKLDLNSEKLFIEENPQTFEKENEPL